MDGNIFMGSNPIKITKSLLTYGQGEFKESKDCRFKKDDHTEARSSDSFDHRTQGEQFKVESKIKRIPEDDLCGSQVVL